MTVFPLLVSRRGRGRGSVGCSRPSPLFFYPGRGRAGNPLCGPGRAVDPARPAGPGRLSVGSSHSAPLDPRGTNPAMLSSRNGGAICRGPRYWKVDGSGAPRVCLPFLSPTPTPTPAQARIRDLAGGLGLPRSGRLSAEELSDVARQALDRRRWHCVGLWWIGWQWQKKGWKASLLALQLAEASNMYECERAFCVPWWK